MDVVHYPDDPLPANWRAPVLALGNFDGCHRGHAKIVERVSQRGADIDRTPAVLTFDPHPTRIVRPDKAPSLLMTKAQKLAYMADAGLQGAAIVRFTPEVSRWSPDEFVTAVLFEWLHVSEVWVGANFLFGHDRSGNFSKLKSLGGQLGFRVDKIEPVRYKEFIVSSTRIRRLISEGNVDEAGVLLGHHYTIDGEVVAGSGRGGPHGYPTANLRTENETIPPNGVYATTATIDGAMHASVTNIGVRPTFEREGERVIETHLLDFNGDLYGMDVKLAFVTHLRPEMAFAGADELRQQIADDCDTTRGLFDRISL